MLDGDSRPERRTAIIAKELERYNVNIAALQETRIEGKGRIWESKYRIYRIGKTQGRWDAAVAFTVKNNIASRLSQLPTGISERIMSLHIPIGKECYLSLICVYAPTMTYSEDDKEAFYQELTQTVSNVPKADKLVILGDFNGRVGNDSTTHEGVIGKFGKGKRNSNGDLLLNFCSEHDLSITNTFFYQPDKNYYTWMHPRSKHFHLLDYVVTHRVDIREVLSTKAMRGTEWSSDHYMVRTKLRLRLQTKARKTSGKTPEKLNISKLIKPELQRCLATDITSALESKEHESTETPDVENLWKEMKETMYATAQDVLGHPQRKSPDWFQEHDEAIQELLQEKRKLFNIHLQENSERSKAAFTAIKAKVQREIRTIKDHWWKKKAEKLQEMADKNDTHGLYSELRAI